MIELNLNKIVKNYGFKKILNEFNLELKTNEKVALIGPNGSGKTTIFKIIIGEEDIDSGTVSIRKGSKTGMLSQMPLIYSPDTNVIDVIKSSKKNIYELDKKIKKIELKLTKCNQNELDKLIKKLCNLTEEYESIGGYKVESDIAKVCSGFKINELLDRTYNTLSGGEKTIVNFATLILSEPDILLLDEPTNHLDIDTLEWLEEYLKNYKGSVLISSHDRYFLDKVVNRVVLIDRGKEEVFHGNYSYYLKENERRILQEFEEYKNQQKMIEAMKRKIKQLQEFGKKAYPGGENFFKRAASIQKRLDKIEVLDKPEEKKELPLDFNLDYRSGNDVLKINDLSININNKILFENIDMSINYQDKICLMGKNGSGKSTLIKEILDLSDLDYTGNIKIGSNVKIGYLPQEIKFINENNTIIEEVRKYYIGDESHLRALLTKFLFYSDDIYKKLKSLSGGEKVRLKLLELIEQKNNFLILDEPTNHIDIDTREMLEDALKEFDGTILFISHDRYFIDKLANYIYEINNHKIIKHLGNYSDIKKL